MKKVQNPFASLTKKLATPREVQRFLRGFAYNKEKDGPTLKSAQASLKLQQVHCLEAALLAAAIMEQKGFLPQVMSLESKDNLDHVLFVFKVQGRWGAIGRSRDNGLNGRAPVFRSLRDLAWSYFDPYIDQTGRITGYGLALLDDIPVDWRTSKKSVWKVEKYLIDLPHKKLKSSNKRFKKMHQRYKGGIPLRPQKYWW